MLARSAHNWPDHAAVLDGDETITFARLREASHNVARNLAAAGVAEGDHVALFLGESWKQVALIYGVLQLGAVVVPLNITWETAELARALIDSDAKHLIAQGSWRGTNVSSRFSGNVDETAVANVWWSKGDIPTDLASRAKSFDELFAPAVGPVPESTNQLGYITFTSGSSVAPKPALIQHQAGLGVGYYGGKRLELQPGHCFLNISPFYHTGGLILGMLCPHQFGASIRVMEGYQHELMVEAMNGDDSDVLIGFDVVTMRLVRAAQEHGHIPFRKIITGPGFSVYDELTSLRIDHIIIYGMTELTNFAAISSKEDSDAVRRESNGWPLPGVEIRICDYETGQQRRPGELGEIRVKGWNVMLGYYQSGAEPNLPLDADGFFPTGDYGYLDSEGRIYYRGRYSAMVKTGGENVSQAEVEFFLLREIPGLRQAAVVGVPDEQWGEAVVAFVEFEDDAEPLAVDQMRAMCRTKIAGYKVPKRFHVVPKDGWPVTPTGKVIKPDLVRQALADAAKRTDTRV